MNGTVAQAFALTCHAKAALRGLPRRPFFPGNSTARFCEGIDFLSVSLSRVETPVAHDPEEWFDYLKKEGTTGVRLNYVPVGDANVPDRITSAFAGGGGTWGLLSVSGHGRGDFWIARWGQGSRASSSSVWKVTYGRVAAGVPVTPSKAVPDAIQALRAALQDIRNFSLRCGPNNFSGIFTRALLALEPDARVGEDDWAPPGLLGRDARALLEACRQGWVFGGMGSWNDTGGGGPDYDLVSEQLYRAITDGVCAAANA